MLKILLGSIACILTASCGKHIYTLNAKEINRYALQAREPGLGTFVVNYSGDTIKGSSLKRKHVGNDKKESWSLDGKQINRNSVVCFQDKNMFRSGEHTRILKGKISLYVKQTLYSKTETYRDPVTKISVSRPTTATHTTFPILRNGTMYEVSYNELKRIMKDCPSAFTQVDKEFANTAWVKPKNADSGINDYRALIRIIKLYNACE